MKVRIEIDEKLQEQEVVIKCNALDEKTKNIYEVLMNVTTKPKHLLLYKDGTEYYLAIDSILFFETMDGCIHAYTVDNVYQTGYRLYELEEILPGYFIRVSKSTILNLNHIYSITRNLTAASVVQLMNTHKQVYVSRYYYKPLKSIR